jgi:AraC-like DNA-binding protein
MTMTVWTATGFGDPISAVARRWGFIDASSFARSSEPAFGLSLREWREMNRRPR